MNKVLLPKEMVLYSKKIALLYEMKKTHISRMSYMCFSNINFSKKILKYYLEFAEYSELFGNMIFLDVSKKGWERSGEIRNFYSQISILRTIIKNFYIKFPNQQSIAWDFSVRFLEQHSLGMQFKVERYINSMIRNVGVKRELLQKSKEGTAQQNDRLWEKKAAPVFLREADDTEKILEHLSQEKLTYLQEKYVNSQKKLTRLQEKYVNSQEKLTSWHETEKERLQRDFIAWNELGKSQSQEKVLKSVINDENLIRYVVVGIKQQFGQGINRRTFSRQWDVSRSLELVRLNSGWSFYQIEKQVLLQKKWGTNRMAASIQFKVEQYINSMIRNVGVKRELLQKSREGAAQQNDRLREKKAASVFLREADDTEEILERLSQETLTHLQEKHVNLQETLTHLQEKHVNSQEKHTSWHETEKERLQREFIAWNESGKNQSQEKVLKSVINDERRNYENLIRHVVVGTKQQFRQGINRRTFSRQWDVSRSLEIVRLKSGWSFYQIEKQVLLQKKWGTNRMVASIQLKVEQYINSMIRNVGAKKELLQKSREGTAQQNDRLREKKAAPVFLREANDTEEILEHLSQEKLTHLQEKYVNSQEKHTSWHETEKERLQRDFIAWNELGKSQSQEKVLKSVINVERRNDENLIRHVVVGTKQQFRQGINRRTFSRQWDVSRSLELVRLNSGWSFYQIEKQVLLQKKWGTNRMAASIQLKVEQYINSMIRNVGAKKELLQKSREGTAQQNDRLWEKKAAPVFLREADDTEKILEHLSQETLTHLQEKYVNSQKKLTRLQEKYVNLQETLTRLQEKYVNSQEKLTYLQEKHVNSQEKLTSWHETEKERLQRDFIAWNELGKSQSQEKVLKSVINDERRNYENLIRHVVVGTKQQFGQGINRRTFSRQWDVSRSLEIVRLKSGWNFYQIEKQALLQKNWGTNRMAASIQLKVEQYINSMTRNVGVKRELLQKSREGTAQQNDRLREKKAAPVFLREVNDTEEILEHWSQEKLINWYEIEKIPSQQLFISKIIENASQNRYIMAALRNYAVQKKLWRPWISYGNSKQEKRMYNTSVGTQHRIVYTEKSDSGKQTLLEVQQQIQNMEERFQGDLTKEKQQSRSKEKALKVLEEKVDQQNKKIQELTEMNKELQKQIEDNNNGQRQETSYSKMLNNNMKLERMRYGVIDA